MKNIKIMKIKVRKRREKRLIGNKTKQYIILGIIACCFAIGLNIHPNNKNNSLNTQSMIYVFHDYEKNPYIINNSSHGSADELEFLFNDTIPEDLKGEDYNSNTVSLKDLEGNDTYDNQITIEEIMNELGIDNEYSGNIRIIDEPTDNSGIDENTLIIDLSKESEESQTINNNKEYTIEQNGSTLTITKSKNFTVLNNKGNFKNTDGKKSQTIKNFQTIAETRVLPSLIPLTKLNDLNNNSYTSYSENNENTENNLQEDNNENYVNSENIGGINILPDYADCMTPRGYKISHGESVLAYKQMDNSPNICNIERRFCWNGKLSGSYPQQGCTIKGSYYSDAEQDNSKSSNKSASTSKTSNTSNTSTKKTNTQYKLRYKSEDEGSFIFDKPNESSTTFHRGNDNIKTSKSTEQTKKEHINCTTPRLEEVQHGQLVQAFKHANGFYDIPCETQIRLCSMGKLDGSYKQKSCKGWESSFSNRFNGGANKDKYYEKKLEKIKQKIENEETYYNELKGLSEEEALDKIFYRLDE